MAKSEKMIVSPRITLIGGIFAVVAMIVWLGATLGGVLLYTVSPLRPLHVSWLPVLFNVIPVVNTGYSMFYMFVSELGIGPTAFMVNVGWMITGFLAVPVFPALWRLLRGAIAKIGVVVGAVGFISLIGIGYHPMVVSPLHSVFGMISFVGTGVAVFLVSYVMLKGTFFSKAIVVTGFAYAAVDLIFLLTHLTIFEWGVFFIGGLWVLAVGIQMILKRNVTEV